MSVAVQNLKAILRKQLSTSQKFTDDQFPPTPSVTLGSTYSKYHLRRVSDLYGELSIFPEEISANGIEAGLLKDAYFLSAVATLAEEPALLKRLFLTEEPNKVGLYAIWLCDNGTWKPVLIDDYIPCSLRSGSYFPLFAQGHNTDLWISLLEKAYAKIYGSYANLEGGSCQHALRDLTGAPVEDLRDEADVEKVWAFIHSGIEKNFFLCCSNEIVVAEDKKKKTEGPANTFSYGILDAREVESERGVERLIMIRNPWGSLDWKGEWSNTSELWTEELREKLNYHAEDAKEGIFWVTVEEYVNYFSVTSVCKYKPENKYYSVDIHHDNKNHSVVRIRVPKDQEVTISLNQKDSRCFADMNKLGKYKYSYSRLLLGKVYDEGLGYITGNASETQRNLQVTETLKAGTYVLSTEVHWNQNFCRDFNISFYTEGELEFELVPEADLLTIQKSIILSSIEKVESSRKVRTYAKYGDSQIEKTEGNLHGLLYFYYLNDTKKSSKLTEKVTFSTLDHIQICAPYNNLEQFEVTVFPDREVLVLYKTTQEDYAWSYSTSFRIQPLSLTESSVEVNQEVYDYVDDEEQKAHININEDYNSYVQQGLDLDLDENNALAARKNISRTLEKDFSEERKTAESWTRSTAEKPKNAGHTRNESEISSPVKKYPILNMESGQSNAKKISYTNYDDFDKQLQVFSSNPQLLQIKDTKLKVKAGETASIRLKFNAPRKGQSEEVAVEIVGKGSVPEETLHFVLNNVSGR